MRVAFEPDLLFDGEQVHRGAVVVVEDGAIVEIAREAPAVDERLRLAERALIPGGVNAHSHGFHSLLRGFGDDLTFSEWRDRSLYRFAPRLRRDGVYNGAMMAFAEMLLYGVTTTCDFFYLNDDSNENARTVVRAAKDVGIRLVLARAFYDWDGAPAAFREDVREATARFEELRLSYLGDPLITVIPAPHSLRNASEKMIQAGAEAAAAAGCPFQIHVAEQRSHVEDAFRCFGKSPARALDALGVLGAHTVLIHGCWLDERERALVAERGAALVHCPGANMFLGDGIADVADLVRRGGRVALGTDGGSTNSRLSIYDEMRTCALLQKVARTDGQALDAPTAFRLGTAAGGDALGLPVGRIAPGQRADLVAVDLQDPSLWPEQTFAKNLVYGMSHRAVTDVFVDGRAVVRDRALCHVDLAALRERVRATTRDWTRR